MRLEVTNQWRWNDMRRQRLKKITMLLCCMLLAFFIVPSFHVYGTVKQETQKENNGAHTIAEVKQQVNIGLARVTSRDSRMTRDARRSQSNRELLVLLLCVISCYLILHKKNQKIVILQDTYRSFFHRQLAVIHQMDGKKRF